jgi:hypothetical protein
MEASKLNKSKVEKENRAPASSKMCSSNQSFSSNALLSIAERSKQLLEAVVSRTASSGHDHLPISEKSNADCIDSGSNVTKQSHGSNLRHQIQTLQDQLLLLYQLRLMPCSQWIVKK